MKTFVLGQNAARRLKGLLAGRGESSRRQIGAPGVAIDAEYAAPYTVQWAQSANEGTGAWIIWLYDEHMLTVNGTDLDPSGDLEPAGGDYPEGWFALDEISEGAVFLNVRIPKDGSAPTCAISGSTIASDDDERAVNVCIADVSRSSDGASVVKQFVWSSVVIDNTSEDGAPTPFRIAKESKTEQGQTVKKLSIVDGKLWFNGEVYFVADFAVPDPSPTGTITLIGEEQDGYWSFSVGLNKSQPQGHSVWMPLYELKNGEVLMDYRTTFFSWCDGVWTLKGDCGEYETSDAEKVYGDASIVGDVDSGLKVHTTAGKITLDLANRTNGDSFGIQEVTDAEGSVVSKVLGTSGFSLASGISADKTFSVITDIQFDAYSHFIQVKTRDVNVDNNGKVTSIGDESDWIDKIQTVPHVKD